MTYKTNYELWNPALSSRRPSHMSDIDIVLAQTYPHVAMLPYMQCQHCSYEEPEDQQHPSSPSSFTSTFSGSTLVSEDYSADALSATMSNQHHGWSCPDNRKRSKIRRRLRQLLKRSSA